MAALTGKKPKDTYKDLLQVSNSNAGIDGTLRFVSDGEGTDSTLKLSTSSISTTSKVVVGGDTAAGDDAAIGYTSAEGLIITGQGSTSDITVKNDADAAVLTVATGTTNVDIVGDVTASTVNADGDTSAGDDAAMGYTSAEGLILTGQGSTNDITIKNDADADVITVATGGTNVDVVGDLTAATLNADGDTSAGDDAAIGYTSAEGLILTGQGSTNDVTIKNDADADVLTIATGGTNVDIVGDVTAATVNADGDTSAGDDAAMGYTSAEGLILTGQGSTNDVTIKNDADQDVLEIPTGTQNVTMAGNLSVAGDLTITGDDLVMSTNTSGAALIADGTNFNPVVISGDVSIGTDGAATIANDAVTLAKMAGLARGKLIYGDSSGDPAALAVGSANNVLKTDGTDVSWGTVATAGIADDAVTLAKMAGLARGKIIYGDSSGNPAALAVGSANYVLTSDGTDISWAAAAGGGKVLQVVTAATSTEATSTSTTYADTNLTADITPANSSNKVLVLVSQSITSSGNRAGGAIRILRGTTEIEEYNQISNVENQMGQHFIQHLDSPSSTSSTTYHTEFKRIDQSGTVVAQRNDASGNATSTITLIEIGA